MRYFKACVVLKQVILVVLVDMNKLCCKLLCLRSYYMYLLRELYCSLLAAVSYFLYVAPTLSSLTGYVESPVRPELKFVILYIL